MDYRYEDGDEDALIALLGPLFTPFAEPMDVQVPLRDVHAWSYLRHDLRLTGNRLLRLELDEDERNSTDVLLGEFRAFGEPSARLDCPAPEEQKLWRAVSTHSLAPPSMEVIVRDLLLSTGVDTTPANANRVIDGYRAVAQGPSDALHVALAILRANTIARSRSMPVETAIRAEILALAERAHTQNVLPGISLRHAGAIAQLPRTGTRAADELRRLAKVLDHIEGTHRDESTVDWIASYRLAAAETEANRDIARRQHVEQFLAISDDDTAPLRAMLWAEKAVALASAYGIHDLHEAAVRRMQRLSRTDLGWNHHVSEVQIPIAIFRQRERRNAKLSSWEQALAVFLASDSPAGNTETNEQEVAGRRLRILDIVNRRVFGTHQLPERTQKSPEDEHLARVVQMNLATASSILRLDLTAIASRFGVPAEDKIAAFLSTNYGSAPILVRLYAQALRLYWGADPSGAARLAIPLIETGARELLLLMDEPLYRMERGVSPGRFPAMDFYIEKLEQAGLDLDWAAALRGTLLSTGMNLRNRLAHGFQLEFSAEETALVLRLAGLFVGMPVGTDAIDDGRVRTPLATPRHRLRRRPGWMWQ